MKHFYWLIPLLMILIVASLSIGASSHFSWQGFFEGGDFYRQVFFTARLPRTLAIILSAGAMSLAGLLMQTVTQNAFAAPSTVGTTEAAQLGLLISLFIFPQASLGQKAVFAFSSAMLFTFFFIKMVRKLRFKESWMLPLVGLIYAGIIGSIAKMISYQFNLVQSMSSWAQGSFAMVQPNQYEWLFLNGIMIIAIWRLAESFSLMSLGLDTSRMLGLSYERLEGLALLLIALTTAVTMMTVGSLPFVGLVVPNLVRMKQGDHIRKNMWLVFLVGTCLVMASDVFARLVIRPYELSVSVVLGIIGAAIFIVMLWRGGDNARD